MKHRLTPLLIGITIFLAACVPASSSSSTTEPLDPPDSSSTPGSATTGSTVIEGGRAIETVGCEDPPEDVAIVCEVFDLIQERYVDEISDATLAESAELAVSDLDGSTSDSDLTCPLPSSAFEAACLALADEAESTLEGAEAMVRGMAAALDPNSLYLDEESVALIEEEQEGQIEGIGALVTAEDSAITEGNSQCSTISATCELIIVSTISDSPAEAAGIQEEDRIVGVDGEDIRGWTLDEVTATVRGPAGTDVLLTVERADETFDVSITRAAVVIPVVDSAVYDGIGYVKLNLFSENADEQLETALDELIRQNPSEIVLDLSDNPGGLLDTSIEIVSMFLADGEVVITEGPNDNRRFDVSGNIVVPESLPMTVIVNGGSASASEVVSAVLQERGRATVVGENSFGKNTVQQRFSLSNGGAFKVTIARWLTPGGVDFGDGGVTPDVEQEFAPELDQEAIALLAASLN
ncbi:MAG TPA: S41 family peptidase [Acidimicrobiia bacterium]